MKTLPLLLTADSAPDANGFVTLRHSDGSAHGNTDLPPVATVYTLEDAARIAQKVNAFPVLLATLKEAESVIRWAAQEAAGRVKGEIVAGWTHHADKAAAAIALAENQQAQG